MKDKRFAHFLSLWRRVTSAGTRRPGSAGLERRVRAAKQSLRLASARA